ncbi:tyrosine recombinase xerD [Desulfocucumis palustris]|uniref:Tyrosine recombinase xerD n=1 Tax=Desulfocucumis palustris TaxID=1898651 RepID=A0A2L2XGH8_9FIRM|nr:tyrosine-type recombinase/integrase [Desulfocucumis palustris]GBF35338.1 tyrosine recombinase xerD [Desulfocucumis palustris]
MRLKEAIDLFLAHMESIGRSQATLRSYRQRTRYFYNYLADRFNCDVYLEDITTPDVEDYLGHMYSRGLTPATRKSALAVARTLFNYCQRRGHRSDNPAACVEAVKLEQKERVFLEEAEVMALADNASTPLMRSVFLFLYYTGLRISECLNLTLGDIDLDQGIIRVRHGKGGKSRLVPVSKSLRPVLVDHLTRRPATGTDRFFATRTGGLCRAHVDKCLKKAAQKTGLGKKVSPHILRHSFASQLVKKQVNIVNIQKLLGHASLKTTSIYTHTSLEDLVSSVNRL